MSIGTPNLITRISKIEEQLDKNEKLLTKICHVIEHIKEKNMSEFDFDSLLNELDTPAVEVKEDVVEAPNEAVVPEEVAVVVETPQEPVAKEDIIEELIENPITEPTDMNSEIYDASQAKIKELEDEVKTLKEKIKGVKSIQSAVVSDEVISKYEYSKEAKSFLRDNDELEMEKRNIVERQKALKEEAKESGVDVAATLKAQKELIKELKETADESAIIEQMKAEIKADDALMTSVTIYAG